MNEVSKNAVKTVRFRVHFTVFDGTWKVDEGVRVHYVPFAVQFFE